jgi:hypothetical protein
MKLVAKLVTKPMTSANFNRTQGATENVVQT